MVFPFCKFCILCVLLLLDLNKDFVILPSNKVRVAENSISVLRCKPPTGLPIPKVFWEKNDKPVKSLADERFQETKQGDLLLLKIRETKVLDSGHYQCVASNFVGRSESPILKLKVYGKCYFAFDLKDLSFSK